MSKLSDALLALAGNRLIDDDYKPVIIGREQVRALAAQAQKLERDAARYRWLRDVGDETWTALVVRARQAFPHVPHSEVPSMVDEIINGAIDRERGND